MQCFKCGSPKTYKTKKGTSVWVSKPEGTYCYSCWNRKIATNQDHNGVKNPNYGHAGKYRFNSKSLSNLVRVGSKNNRWKGGITPQNQKARASPEYEKWRIAVFSRDNFTCTVCGIRGHHLHAHHIKPFSTFKELRFNIDNGTTLCIACHKKTFKGDRNISLPRG